MFTHYSLRTWVAERYRLWTHLGRSYIRCHPITVVNESKVWNYVFLPIVTNITKGKSSMHWKILHLIVPIAVTQNHLLPLVFSYARWVDKSFKWYLNVYFLKKKYLEEKTIIRPNFDIFSVFANWIVIFVRQDIIKIWPALKWNKKKNISGMPYFLQTSNIST